MHDQIKAPSGPPALTEFQTGAITHLDKLAESILNGETTAFTYTAITKNHQLIAHFSGSNLSELYTTVMELGDLIRKAVFKAPTEKSKFIQGGN